jgi:hypothetical protein
MERRAAVSSQEPRASHRVGRATVQSAGGPLTRRETPVVAGISVVVLILVAALAVRALRR